MQINSAKRPLSLRQMQLICIVFFSIGLLGWILLSALAICCLVLKEPVYMCLVAAMGTGFLTITLAAGRPAFQLANRMLLNEQKWMALREDAVQNFQRN